ncbi:phospholipase D family protein [Pedobacter africanus]|uniref:PLD-like domain-containing protein n=1 Tax=Pedobacter africanus TaxID=151894 RepID=A0A1W2CTD0_9SPHI|nr:phospholipase D family protein [Pedobacter africanus]SMC88489.1 PLD-like domain-containing protein [Pedobacter africanus]
MPELINRFEVHKRLINMIDEAKSQLIFISPYIKLHDAYKNVLQKRVNDDELEVIVVFGKNEEDKHKSLSNEDFAFFKQFQNVTIKYCKRLHAKIYANDSHSLFASMNLHSFSADNNIEAGILCKFRLLKSIVGLGSIITELTGASLDQQVYHFSYEIIDKYSKTVFEKKPVYKEIFFTKEFLRSDVIIDCNDDYEIGDLKFGYCIRTGTKIPFNVKKPYCAEAYKSWSKYGNVNYMEKFCHYSGEPSNGETGLIRL